MPRVVITGMGVVSAAGVGVDAFWQMVMGGPPEDPEFGFRMVPEISDDESGLTRRERRRLDPSTQYALIAAKQAAAQAGIGDVDDPRRYGVIIGGTLGGFQSLEDQLHGSWFDDRDWSPLTSPKSMVNAAAATVAIAMGWRGPCEAICGACASSLQSLDAAMLMIQAGRCDAMLVGGTDATDNLTSRSTFRSTQSLSVSGASRPFDKNRDGLVVSEGAVVLCVESLDHAQRRGATILAEVLSTSTNGDAHHITNPRPDGLGAEECMDAAVSRADLEPADIAWIAAHGTATDLNDIAEGAAINRLFGPNSPPTTSLKGATGHPWASSGAAGIVAAVCAMGEGTLPPTYGFETPDPDIAKFNLLTEPADWQPGSVLSNSFGLGGHNACAVVAPFDS